MSGLLTGGAMVAELKKLAADSSAAELEKARVVEEWSDPQSGELYIWLVTPN